MKLKILIFIDWFAPGFKAGGPTTSNVNLVEHLKDIFDFYVITTDTDYHESHPYSEVISDKWVAQNGFYTYYFNHKNLSFAKLKEIVQQSECSIWYVNGIYSKYFSIYPLLLAKLIKPKRIIVSARGMLSPHALAIKSTIKKGYLLGAKSLGLFHNVKFHATNDEEAFYIKQVLGKNCDVHAVENLPRKMNNDSFVTDKNDSEIRLVSFARISPEKNTLYAIECLKYCKEHVIYHIYGQINSPSYWHECELAIMKLPNNVSVEYKGSVSPKEMSNVYRQYHFLFLPSTGENFGHAILESFMNSSPVIISNRTPWKSLRDKNIGWDLPLDNKQAFAAVIDKCVRLSREQYVCMANNAYNFAKSICDNKLVKLKYIELFEK